MTTRSRTTGMTALLAALLMLCGLLTGCDYGDRSDHRGIVRLGAPPMGWNSWNAFGCGVTESEVHAAADALVTSGMRDAGYRYVVVDDCWFDRARTADGSLRANPRTFPSGMAALGRFLHERGLKFGIYESPSTRTCAQQGGSYPGSTGSSGHIRQDADTFASWAVDYLKYDWCSAPAPSAKVKKAFRQMRAALQDTGRPIVLSVNPNSLEARPAVPETLGSTGDWSGTADLVRTGQDVYPLWDNAIANEVYVNGAYTIAGIRDSIARAATIPPPSGYFNDPDMLVIGTKLSNFGFPTSATVPMQLPASQARVQMVMWAMLGAPLMAGTDLTRMSAQTRSLLTDSEILAIDQDRSPPARRVGAVGAIEIWSRTLSTGDRAIALYNPTSSAASARLDDPLVGLRSGCRASDLANHAPTPTTASITVRPTSVELYRVDCR